MIPTVLLFPCLEQNQRVFKFVPGLTISPSYGTLSISILDAMQLSQAVHSAQLNDKIRRWKHELEVMNMPIDVFDSLENRIEAILRGNPY